MVAHRGGVESGINSAKQHSKARPNHVLTRLVFGREQLFFGWLPGSVQSSGLLDLKASLLRGAPFGYAIHSGQLQEVAT